MPLCEIIDTSSVYPLVGDSGLLVKPAIQSCPLPALQPGSDEATLLPLFYTCLSMKSP